MKNEKKKPQPNQTKPNQTSKQKKKKRKREKTLTNHMTTRTPSTTLFFEKNYKGQP
jgi:hypothetical protein